MKNTSNVRGKKILYGILVIVLLVMGLYLFPGDIQTATQTTTPTTVIESSDDEISEDVEVSKIDTYVFRNEKLLNQHYDKHGRDMGFSSASEYQSAASDVINNPLALSKTEAEDGDLVYYVESTNEFVVLSTDGYIRTYFLPDSGKKYYDKQ